jgi:hypothetical protein
MSGLGLPISAGSGLVPVTTVSQMQADEKRQAEATQLQPVIQGLAQHVRRCFDSASQARQQKEEDRMLKCIRQRKGEYDPDVLSQIQKSGGSLIYMMLTGNKCRSAASWIRDVMFGVRDQRPWDVKPTAEPSLSPMDMQRVAQIAGQEAIQLEMQMGVGAVTPDQMHELVTRIKDKTMSLAKEQAKKIIDRMKGKMDDQLQEGGFYKALGAFIDDLVTFPFAVMKGPVPRKVRQLKWKPAGQGNFAPEVEDVIQLCWDRVDPFMFYWAPHATDVDDGYIIERHHLTRGDLQELIGVEGYDDAAIRAVLEDHGQGGLRDWLSIDSSKAHAEGKSETALMGNPEATIDALQYWGSVQGKMLIDWGMEESEMPDPLGEYPCEVWVIGRWVIKATMNPDPCGRKPYYKTSYEEVPGSFTGNGVCDLSRDTQNMCNAAARALSNNMGISSGPQMYITSDRLPPGEDVTEIFPWKIWQVTSDPYGSTAKPIEFFQPTSNAQELMQIYDKFSILADEYTGVPRYMTGDSPAGGAGRTASGMSMLMNNAGKSIKQVIGNVDMNVIQPLIDRLYYYNMKYAEDPALKGDVRIVACGVNILIAQEAVQVRMNEILNIVATNPMFIEIVGEEAIADLLREVCKPLNMDVVPPKEVIRARMLMRQQMMMLQAMGGAQAGQGGPGEKEVNAPPGKQNGKKVMPGNQQRLMNGAPITDNHAPARR